MVCFDYARCWQTRTLTFLFMASTLLPRRSGKRATPYFGAALSNNNGLPFMVHYSTFSSTWAKAAVTTRVFCDRRGPLHQKGIIPCSHAGNSQKMPLYLDFWERPKQKGTLGVVRRQVISLVGTGYKRCSSYILRTAGQGRRLQNLPTARLLILFSISKSAQGVTIVFGQSVSAPIESLITVKIISYRNFYNVASKKIF